MRHRHDLDVWDRRARDVHGDRDHRGHGGHDGQQMVA